MNTITDPEWIIETEDNRSPHSVQLPEIFAQKDLVRSVVLLWDTNSYYVNVEEGYFIINGGRRLQPTGVAMMEDRRICYARRNSRSFAVGQPDQAQDSVSYLVGVEGRIEGEERQLLLQISSDGRLWVWKDKR